MTQVELVYWWQQLFTQREIMAAIISLPVKMLVAQTLTSGWGCRCEANTNVPGAPRILDPPLVINSRIYKEQACNYCINETTIKIVNTCNRNTFCENGG